MRPVSTPHLAGLSSVRILLDAEKQWYGAIPGAFVSHMVAVGTVLRQGISILTVAHLESFVRDLCEAAIDDINSRSPQIPWSSLPHRLRRAHWRDGILLGEHQRKPGESEQVFDMRMVTEAAQLANLVGSPSATGPYTIVHQPFTRTNSNPDSSQIKKMMKSLGIDVWLEPVNLAHLAPHGVTDADRWVCDQIDLLVQRRHHAAHGRQLTLGNVSRLDLESGIDFLESFIVELETRVASWLATL